MFLRTVFSIILFVNLIFAQTLSVAEAFGLAANADNQNVSFKFNLAKDIYVYKDSFKVSSNGKILNEFLNLPKFINDGTFDIYPEKFEIFIPINLIENAAGTQNLTLTLEYQGCAKNGICYQPQILNYSVVKTKNSYQIAQIGENNAQNFSQIAASSPLSEQDSIAKSLSDKSFIISLITFFGYGLLLSLTPCIFPMIPILSSIIVSKQGSNLAKPSDKKSVKKGFLLSLIYVLGMATAYAIAGIIASMFGSGVQSMLQTPAVLIAFSLIFVALALSMFGLYEIQMPLKLQNLINKKSENQSGLIGIFIMGFLSALIASPCVAAPLAGVLLYIANSGNIALGGIALFIMGLGMGVPLLIIGASSGKILPKPGVWMDGVKKFFGFIMIFMAIWLSARVFGSRIEFLLYGVTGVFMSVFFGAFDSTNESLLGGKKILKSVALLIFIYSFILIIGSFMGAKSLLNPLENFSQNGSNLSPKESIKFNKVSNLNDLKAIVKSSTKPVMIDFYATWCVSCNELDEITFKDKNVQNRLENFTLIKVDVTKNSKDDAQMMKFFSLIGPPALMFFKGGSELENELKNARIIGFIEPEKFVLHLDKFNLQ